MTVRGLTVIISAAFAAAAAVAAEKVEGDYNTSLGYLAGKDATGNRATVMGAGAGGEATGIRSTDFMGAAAGAFSRNVRDSVGVGYRALRDAANCSNVVAIGSRAFAGATNVSDATWLNGHFVARDGGFYITGNAAATGPAAPIYYADGTLHLNAARIVTGGGEIVSGGTSSGVSASYDWYVSAEKGSDSYDGRSPASPFATIEKAWNVASNGDAVAVMPGEYAAPTGLHVDNTSSSFVATNKPVNLYATEGPNRTVLDGGGRAIVGNVDYIPVISGFTIRNLGTCAYKHNSQYNVDTKLSLTMTAFVGCRMAWTNELSGQPSNYGAYCSVFSGCDIFAASAITNWIGGQGYNNFFVGCEFEDSVVKMAPVRGLAYKFGQINAVRNSFVCLDGAKDVGFWMNGPSGFSDSTTWESSTLFATNCTYNKTGTPSVTWSDCLVAAVPSEIGTWPTYKTSNTLFVDYSEISFGSDLRPTAPLHARYYGFDSAADRADKDALVAWLAWRDSQAATNTASAASVTTNTASTATGTE